MAIKFLTPELIEKHQPQEKGLRVEDIVRNTLNAPVIKRGYKKAHSSDLTKATYCPRMVALWREAGCPEEHEKVNATLAMTFRMGNLTAQLFCEDLGGESVWGNWVCRHCDDQHDQCYKPKPCSCHPDATWKYEEIVFVHEESSASGSIDCFMDLRTGKLTLIELKIIGPEDFQKLLMPMWEHRIRTQMYLEIIANSNHPAKDLIHLDTAKVFYMCRTHGKKVATRKLARVTPFKEYDVKPDPAAVQKYLDKARQLKIWEDTGEYPEPLCSSADCDQAKECPYLEKCIELGGFPL